jgi:rhodanese-related sulfurtransferase
MHFERAVGMNEILQLEPCEVKARLDAGDDLALIDVRETPEFAFNRIDGAQLHPLSEIYQWVNALDKEREYVVYCHHGMRSMQACMFMRRNGFSRLANLAGGIDAWSREVDPAVPLY